MPLSTPLRSFWGRTPTSLTLSPHSTVLSIDVHWIIFQPLVQTTNMGMSHWVCPSYWWECFEGVGQPQFMLAPVRSDTSSKPPHEPTAIVCPTVWEVDLQPNCTNYRPYSLAFATTLCSGGDPLKLYYKVTQMRNHLNSCLDKEAQPFPATRCGGRWPRNIRPWKSTVTVECQRGMPSWCSTLHAEIGSMNTAVEFLRVIHGLELMHMIKVASCMSLP